MWVSVARGRNAAVAGAPWWPRGLGLVVVCKAEVPTGVALGSERSTGATHLAETWPDRLRSRAAGAHAERSRGGVLRGGVDLVLRRPIGRAVVAVDVRHRCPAGVVRAVAAQAGAGVTAERLGRRPTAAILFAGAFLLTPAVFFWARGLPALLVALTLNGVFTTGQYSWMAIWLPELYPTRVRGAGVASVFTASRLIACIGPLVAGGLIVALGGYGTTAETFGCIHLVGLAAVWLLPETRGRPAAGRLTRASPPPAAVMASGCPERCRPPRRPLGRRGRA